MSNSFAIIQDLPNPPRRKLQLVCGAIDHFGLSGALDRFIDNQFEDVVDAVSEAEMREIEHNDIARAKTYVREYFRLHPEEAWEYYLNLSDPQLEELT